MFLRSNSLVVLEAMFQYSGTGSGSVRPEALFDAPRFVRTASQGLTPSQQLPLQFDCFRFSPYPSKTCLELLGCAVR